MMEFRTEQVEQENEKLGRGEDDGTVEGVHISRRGKNMVYQSYRHFQS